MSLTTKIREYRARDKLSQEELAQKVGVRRETIGNLENGKYNPSLKLAMDIAKVFDAPWRSCFSLRIDVGLPPCRESPCGAAAFFFGRFAARLFKPAQAFGRPQGPPLQRKTEPERWFGKLRRETGTVPEANFANPGPQWGRKNPHPSTPGFTRRKFFAWPKG